MIIAEFYLTTVRQTSLALCLSQLSVLSLQTFYDENFLENNISVNNSDILYVLITAYNVDICTLKQYVEKMYQLFTEVRVILYGFDSTLTNTVEKIVAWQNSSQSKNVTDVKSTHTRHIFLQPIPDLAASCAGSRTIKLGRIRNYLQQALISDVSTYYNKTDHIYVLVYDGDHLGALSMNGLLSSINDIKSGKYDVAAYGTVEFLGCDFLYYSYAFRILGNDWRKRGSHLDIISVKMGSQIYPVHSEFSGAAVYKYNDYIQARYGEEDDLCEHVILHQSLYKQGKIIVINKKMHAYIGYQPSIK